MKKSIVFASNTGNTKKLAEAIYNTLGEEIYCGKISEEAMESDVIFVGSWTMAFLCVPDIKEFLEKLNGKKVFLFMTAGYGDTDEYLTPIIDSMKANLNDTNEVIGSFICQGEVSQPKQEAIKKMDMAKYENMKANLDKSVGCPTQESIDKLIAMVKSLDI